MEIVKLEKHPGYGITRDAKCVNLKTGRVLKQRFYKGKMIASAGGDKVSINRAVAEAFIENPLNYCYVLHKDGNKQRNDVENLYWSKSNRVEFRRKVDPSLLP